MSNRRVYHLVKIMPSCSDVLICLFKDLPFPVIFCSFFIRTHFFLLSIHLLINNANIREKCILFPYSKE